MKNNYFKRGSWIIFLFAAVSCTSGIQSPGTIGWDSSEVNDEILCKFTDSQIQNLLNILEKCSQRLEGRSTSNQLCSIQYVALTTRHIGKCDQYLKKIELGLVKVTNEAMRLKGEGADVVESTEKIKKLEDANRNLNNALQNLLRQHHQELAKVEDKFNRLIHQYKADITRLSNELKKTQEELFNGKLCTIVLKLKYETVEDAIEVVKYFFERDIKQSDKLAGRMLKNAINQVYSFRGMQFWGKLMQFIDKFPNWSERFEGYHQLLNEMNPLVNKDADILLKFAYKIKKELLENNTLSAMENEMLKDSFPQTVRDLMWHDQCHIKNKKYAHYMKVVSEDQHGTIVYHMVGENNTSGDSQWRLNPYQSAFPDGPVKFRVENIGTGKYLKDFGVVEFASTVGSAEATNAKWEVKFVNNRVAFQNYNSEFYLYAPAIKKYLYESQRTWEPWRCGFNQWLDCAVISQEDDKMYDDGKWILECKN